MDDPSTPALLSSTLTTSTSSQCSSTTMAVMILVVLAISMCASGFFSKSTWPVSAWTSMAEFAETASSA